MNLKITFLILCSMISAISMTAKGKNIKMTYEDVYARYGNNTLILGNSEIERKWKWTGFGFATVSVKNNQTGKLWTGEIQEPADWEFPGNIEIGTGKLVSINARVSDDEKFTEKHIEVIAEIEYPDNKLAIKYRTWCYPEGPGIRTQVLIKALEGFGAKEPPEIAAITVDKIKLIHASSTLNGSIQYTDMQEDKNVTVEVPVAPENILDLNPDTYWQSEVHDRQPERAAELWFDLGTIQKLNGIGLQQLRDYLRDGAAEKALVYTSNDTLIWGKPISALSLSRQSNMVFFELPETESRFVRLVLPHTSRKNYDIWSGSLAECRFFTNEYPYKTQHVRTDFIPLQPDGYLRRAIGYYADNQFRNDLSYPLYKEDFRDTEVQSEEIWDWNNILSVENNEEGICLVKESNKTASQKGHFTGDFRVSKRGIEVTGCALGPDEIIDQYREYWATWCIVYEGGESERQLAIKKFDRLRFPSLQADKTSYYCTWGYAIAPESGWREKMDGAIEKNFLKELEVGKQMGIETYLIDAGWDTDSLSLHVKNLYRPEESIYPNEWQTVTKRAEELNVDLALWTSIDQPFSDLTWNQERGKFVNWKWDFATYNDYQSREKIIEKARKFIGDFDHQVSLTWDLTEVYPRYGFYWAREYGNIWWANKEPFRHILYTPSVVLRDAWDLSRYLNINKFQLAIRNTERVLQPSDAYLHTNDYAVAITFMAIPMFFERLQSYTPESRKLVKETLEMYKKERDALNESYVFPIGKRPNNDQITGLQAYNSETGSGHILVFRELFCPENTKDVQLHFIRGGKIKLTNVKTGKEKIVPVSDNGFINITIDKAADFRFYRYVRL